MRATCECTKSAFGIILVAWGEVCEFDVTNKATVCQYVGETTVYFQQHELVFA